MKIKTDFVTNSSSSSFIVFWPYKIVCRKDVENYIKRSDFVSHIYRDSSIREVLKLRGELVKKDDKNLIQAIAAELRCGWVEGIDDFDFQNNFIKKNLITRDEYYENQIWQRQCWEEERKLREIKSIEMAIDLVTDNEGRYAYIYEYSDEDGGIFSELEHQNNWGGLPHIRISKH